MGRIPAVLITCAALCVAHAASASPKARLVYGRGPGAESCPDESTLRRAVAARIGYDPFFPWAPTTVVATISSRGERLVAHVELVGEGAHSEGARELAADGQDCGPLVDTLALTISIAIDPHALAGAPAPPQEPAPPPSESMSAPHVEAEPPPVPPTAPAEQPAPSPSPSRARVSSELYAHLRASLGTQPDVAPGAAIGGALVSSNASVGVELFGDLPTSTDVSSGGSVRGWLFGASLVPCLRLGVTRACGLGTVGRFEGSGSGVWQPETHAAPFVALGGRAGIEFRVREPLTFGIHGDLQVDIDRASLRVGRVDVWTASRVVGALAASGGVSF